MKPTLPSTINGTPLIKNPLRDYEIKSNTKTQIINTFVSKSLKIFLIAYVFFCSNLVIAQVYTFTNAGATGRYGPTQAQLNTAYTSTELAGLVTSISGIQSWIVPFSGTYDITAAGAQGGVAQAGSTGGLGATVKGTFELSAGDEIWIIVGQTGTIGTGGSGGGGSFVVNVTTDEILLVAGGGGGSMNSTGQPGTATNNGTQNGGNTASIYAACGGGYATDGRNSNNSIGNGPAGGGASFLNGGAGGAGANSGTSVGGFGGGGGGMNSCGGSCGGGGGGGYHGGNSTGDYGFGGGSFNAGDNQTNTSGNRSGNGLVIIDVISVVGSDIEVISVTPVSAVPLSMCVTNEYEFDVTLKSNGPGFRSRVDLQIYMTGIDTILIKNFSITDLAIGQTKTYRIQTERITPSKMGNHLLTLKIMNDDDDVTNNIISKSWVVNELPSGSVITPGTAYPGFPSQGTSLNRDIITYGKSFTYVITPPSKFTNNQHGTQWQSTFSAAINGVPLPGSKYTFTAPVGSSNASVTLNLTEDDVEGDLVLNFNVLDKTGSGCDSNATRHIYVAPMPKPMYEGTTICLGDELQFQNRSTINSGVMNFEWYFDDGSPNSFLYEPKHTFTSEGTYKVKMIATSVIGFVDSITLDVEVNSSPIPDFSFQNRCGALPIQFVNNSSIAAGTMNYAWEFGNGETSSEENPNYTYPKPGPYLVTLSIESDKGCFAQLTKSSYSYPTPKVDFTAPITLCAGENITLQNTTNIEFSTWGSEWIIGSSNTRTFTKNPSHIFKQFGEQPVKLKVTTQFGCVDSISKMITVQPGPAIDLTHSNVCSNGPVTFNSNINIPDGMQVDYIWNIAGILYASSNPTVNFGSSGTKSVSVDITYANGCRNNASTQVLTGYRPEVSFSTPDVVCSGLPISLSNNTTIEFGTATHTWIMGDGSIYNDVIVPNHIYTNTTPTDYTITLISSSSNGICPDTVSQNVTVGMVPVCDFDIIPTYVNGHRGYTFAPTQSGSNYQWYFGDGRTSTQESPLYQYQRDGNFPVRLVVTSDEGCQCEKVINNLVINSSVNNMLAENGISIYPNPSSGLVNISNEGNIQIKSIKVMNTVGAIVFDNTITNQLSEYSIDISNVSTGVYMVTIETMDGQQFVQKVIIAK